MAFEFKSHALKNDLKPVKFSYNFDSGKEEVLAKRLVEYKDINFVEHKTLHNTQDINVSKNTCLALTEQMSLNNVFEIKQNDSITLGQISGTFKIKVTNGEETAYLHESNVNDLIVAPFPSIKDLYKSHILTPLKFTLIPRDNQKVEIAANGNKKLYRDLEYPYAIRLSAESISDLESNRKSFFITNKFKEETLENKPITNISIGNNVSNESNIRYLTCNTFDGILRATGTNFNNFEVNQYILQAEFLTEQELNYDYNPKDLHEVKYISNYPSKRNRGNLAIKESSPANVNFLATCAIETIPNFVKQNKNVPLNIATLKTNFSTTGVYNLS